MPWVQMWQRSAGQEARDTAKLPPYTVIRR